MVGFSKSELRFEGGGVLRKEASSAEVVIGRGAEGHRRDILRFEANFGERGVGVGYFDGFRFWLHRRGRQGPAFFLGVVNVFETALVASFDGGYVTLHVAIDRVVRDARKRYGDELVRVRSDGFTFRVLFVQVIEGVLHEHVERFRFDAAGAVEPPLGFGELVGEHLLFGRAGAIGSDDFGLERVEVGLRFAADKQCGRAEPVSETVLAGARFAFGRTGSGGLHGVALVGHRLGNGLSFGGFGGHFGFFVGDAFVEDGLAVEGVIFVKHG